MTAQELERLMERQWGPGWRDKALVSPTGVFPLRDVFEECGLRDPREPEPRHDVGLWQTLPLPRYTGSRGRVLDAGFDAWRAAVARGRDGADGAAGGQQERDEEA